MSTTIGGSDLILPGVPRDAYNPGLILDILAGFWPDAVYENVDDTTWTPLRTLLVEEAAIADTEFFIFRDEASAKDWTANGATDDNANSMLHFIARPDPQRAGLVETTVVIDLLDPDMAMICGRLTQALQNLQHSATPRPASAYRSVEAELRATGTLMSREGFVTLIEELLQSLYSPWTQDELACHPHDALQFCEVVRARIGAPVPDSLIMRVMLNHRKRSVANRP